MGGFNFKGTLGSVQGSRQHTLGTSVQPWSPKMLQSPCRKWGEELSQAQGLRLETVSHPGQRRPCPFSLPSGEHQGCLQSWLAGGFSAVPQLTLRTVVYSWFSSGVCIIMVALSSRCTVDWKKGKNVTVKTIKKKQKHKGRGTVRTITKQVPNDSFFNFFSPLKGE